MHRSDVRAVNARPPRAPLGLGWVGAWAVTVVLMLAAARLAVTLARSADGSFFWPARRIDRLGVFSEDARAALALIGVIAGAAAVTHWRPALSPAVARGTGVLFGLVALWSAINVPVARVLSVPLTYAMLHATGTALGDSVAGFLTVANIAVPVALCLLSVTFARCVRPRLKIQARIPAAAAGIVLAATVLLCATRPPPPSGVEANALWTITRTTAERWLGIAGGERPALSAQACVSSAPPAAPSGAGKGAFTPSRAWMAAARGRSIVWIILESTGARALTAYGGTTRATPHLDAMANESVIFDAAYTAYPESIKGLYSVLCSREPPLGTEASDYGVGRVPCLSIADALAAAGYATGLFHSGWFAYLGMRAVVEKRGFQRLYDAGDAHSPYRSSFGVDERTTVDALLSFVDGVPTSRPFFAVFMPIAGHHPYRAPGAVTRPFPETTERDAYANDLHVADDAVGRLRAGLRARGRDEQIVYVVVGDHGEAFQEHPGNIAHALFLYEENVHVPFFVAIPGAPSPSPGARRIARPVGLLDLAPTTLQLAGLQAAAAHQGRSALDHAGLSPRVVRFATEQAARRAGLRDGRWKFLLDEDSGRAQLFDLNVDPHERADVAARHPALVTRYRACLGQTR